MASKFKVAFVSVAVAAMAMVTTVSIAGTSSAASASQRAARNNAPTATRDSPTVATCTPITKHVFAADYNRGFGVNCAFGVIGVNKNLAGFSHPSTGVFCFVPSLAAKITLTGNALPEVTIEWGDSLGNALLAFYRNVALATDCAAGNLEVQTFDFNAGGAPVASDLVAFHIEAN